jgi:NAD+ kinase
MRIAVRGKFLAETETASRILKRFHFEISDEPDIIIAVGGDGTVLYYYQTIKKPILPVRSASLTSQGYVSDIGIEQLEAACLKLQKKEFYIEKRIMLDVFKNKEKLYSAINDVTIAQVPPDAMRYGVYANGKPLFGYEKIIGDGVTIATPTGSTGYNRSAFGYVLRFCSKQIVATLRYPIVLESKQDRSKKIDENSEIEFKFYSPEKAFLIADNARFTIRSADKIIVRKSNETFDLVRIKGMEEGIKPKEQRRKKWFEKQLF